ncbi:MAG: hypothetical protein PHF51_02455 [Candidatus ainarchaeum sp.]|nr:hypothetical protein [Candidatus ainarchaeum sp.]
MVSILKIFKGKADDPKRWDEAITKEETLQVLTLLQKTGSVDLGKRGLDYLVVRRPDWVHDVAVGETECKLPELRALAKNAFQAWADDPAAFDKLIRRNFVQDAPSVVFEVVKRTSSKDLGERGLKYLMSSGYTYYSFVGDIANGVTKCNLRELQGVAKKVIGAWADDPETLDKIISEYRPDQALYLVANTNSLELAIRGLNFLARVEPKKAVDIAMGNVECNVGHLEGVALGAVVKYHGNEAFANTDVAVDAMARARSLRARARRPEALHKMD